MVGSMKTKTLADYKHRLQKVLNHIGTHLDQPLSLEALASMACFSPYHFHRVFTGMMGESLKEYVRRLKLERAASQLAHGGAVTAAALDAGYESHEAFTRAFKAVFGLAPSAYRSVSGRQASAPSGIHYENDGAVKHFRSQRGILMDVTVKHLDPMRVACVAHVGPYQTVGQAWATLGRVLGPLGVFASRPLMFGICYDDPEVAEPSKIRYDACVGVDAAFVAPDGIAVKTLDGGDYAVALHKGPYDRVGKVYAALYGQWLPRSGYEMRDAPSREVYLNDPKNTLPAELLTEVYAPVRKAG